MSQAAPSARDKNIVLDYPVAVQLNEEVYFADRAEFFVDEHGIQWIKFIAKNGYRRGEEHMIHADRVIVIRRGQQDVD